MSYKTKQEAFTAMKDALATLQKLNLPLPKPYQDLVDKCAKVVAANTKTDAVAMDLGGDKTTLTITIDGLDFVPKHLKILSVANKNTVHNVSKSALTTETVPIDKLKHGETYKVLLYADEKPVPDAKPKNITPFTFDKKYDKVVVKIKTKSKETPQKCSEQDVQNGKIELLVLINKLESELNAYMGKLSVELSTLLPLVMQMLDIFSKKAPDLVSEEMFLEVSIQVFKSSLQYIPVVGGAVKDVADFSHNYIKAIEDNKKAMEVYSKSKDVRTQIMAFYNAQSDIYKNLIQSFFDQVPKFKECKKIEEFKKALNDAINVQQPQIESSFSRMRTAIEAFLNGDPRPMMLFLSKK